jgi:hypothetical protein
MESEYGLPRAFSCTAVNGEGFDARALKQIGVMFAGLF